MPRRTKRGKHLQELSRKKHKIALNSIKDHDVSLSTMPQSQYEVIICDLPLSANEHAKKIATREWNEDPGDDELVFDDEELSLETGDNYQTDNKKKDRVPDILSVYDEMMGAAMKCDWVKSEAKLQTLVMKGDSVKMKKYQKAKQRDLAKAAESMYPLTHWFSQPSNSQLSFISTE